MRDAPMIYADYQATTPVDPRVLERMAPYWKEAFGNPHSSDHAIGWRADKAVRTAAESVADLIGADADEIIFTSGATEANNLALLGLARRAGPGRRRLLVSAIEHKCVLGAASVLSAREGFVVERIPVDREGFLDIGALEGRLADDVLVVSLMAVNNEVGTIQRIPHVADILASYGIPFHCDAAQAPCAMDLAELALHGDMASLSGTRCTGRKGSECSTSVAICKPKSNPLFTVEDSRTVSGRGPCRCRSVSAWEWRRPFAPAPRSAAVLGSDATGSFDSCAAVTIPSQSTVLGLSSVTPATRVFGSTVTTPATSLVPYSRA